MASAYQPRDESLGRYHLFAQLPRGGMAELYVARLIGPARVEKLVVVKRMLPHLGDDPEYVAMFENEARIATRLNHPNVCQAYEFDEADGRPFLVMEFLRGLPWSEAIQLLPRGELPRTRFLIGAVTQACEGLYYAHHLVDVDGQLTPVVHRDVSPGNLMITTDGVVKLLDFGVSKDVTERSATQAGMIKGKLPYMAPEQIRGEPVDGRADIFSLGVMVWEALSGVRLFDRGSDFKIWKAITEEPIPRLPDTPINAALGPVVMRALARDREGRPATARMFAEEFRRALAPFGAAMVQHELQGAVATWMERDLARDSRDLSLAIGQRRARDQGANAGGEPALIDRTSSLDVLRAPVTEVHGVVGAFADEDLPTEDEFDPAAAARRPPTRAADPGKPQAGIALRNVSVVVTGVAEGIAADSADPEVHASAFPRSPGRDSRANHGPQLRADGRSQPGYLEPIEASIVPSVAAVLPAVRHGDQRPVIDDAADAFSEAVTAPRRVVAPSPRAPVVSVSSTLGAPAEPSKYGLQWVIPLLILSIVCGVAVAVAVSGP